ncbi:cysteine-rich CWC family protein [Bacillus sp. FJAT-45350]|uniref:cysteine-rich CWC family protein n=1 Tax=Bacillus sp. FJAT-45350 TaxID=2011014 RepID=UPI000BB83F7B|nr:cysteine-rich CWC family protein [Bacillus sp. FJAT-45350]
MVYVEVNSKSCPLCGSSNDCSKAEGCWCNDEKFPKEILELVPPEHRRKTCICKNCLEKFKENS